MSHSVVGAVAHHDRFFQERDERARGLGEPAVRGLIPIDGEVVGGVALGAGEGRLQPAVEGAIRQLADGFGAGADGCDSQVHLLDRLSPGTAGGMIFGEEEQKQVLGSGWGRAWVEKRISPLRCSR
jgi:hypothetical protein